MKNQLRDGDKVQLKATIWAKAVRDTFGSGTVKAAPGEPAFKGEVFVCWDQPSLVPSWHLASSLEKV